MEREDSYWLRNDWWLLYNRSYFWLVLESSLYSLSLEEKYTSPELLTGCFERVELILVRI